jgi:hypothetical protein
MQLETLPKFISTLSLNQGSNTYIYDCIKHNPNSETTYIVQDEMKLYSTTAYLRFLFLFVIDVLILVVANSEKVGNARMEFKQMCNLNLLFRSHIS